MAAAKILQADAQRLTDVYRRDGAPDALRFIESRRSVPCRSPAIGFCC